jgi:hypothetical protein
MIFLTGRAYSQDCIHLIYFEYVESDRDTAVVSIPVYINNQCPVGGFNLFMRCDAPEILVPHGANTIGSRISSWEYFAGNPGEEHPGSLFVTGVANMPGEPETPPLEEGDGLLFNALFAFGCDFSTDTTVQIVIDEVFVSNPDGELDSVYIDYDFIYVGQDTAIRGDANCNGQRTGSDVTYLVSYFKGLVGCTCSLRAGDVNGDGNIAGNDVTYLVRYFKFGEPAPPP